MKFFVTHISGNKSISFLVLYRKKEHNQHSSVKCYDNYSYYLDVTNPLKIPMIFIFEKGCDKKEFCRENSKCCRESKITTREVEPCKCHTEKQQEQKTKRKESFVELKNI